MADKTFNIIFLIKEKNFYIICHYYVRMSHGEGEAIEDALMIYLAASYAP